MPIKQSVYALPFSQEAREDFGWILNEILDNGKLSPKEANAVARIKSRFREVVALDFFNAPERGAAEILLRDLDNVEAARAGTRMENPLELATLQGKTWITRSYILWIVWHAAGRSEGLWIRMPVSNSLTTRPRPQ